MKNIKRKIKSNNNSISLLRFVTSYSILLIFVLIMGMFLYQYGIDDVKDNLHKQNKLMFSNAASDLDDALDLMSTIAIQIGNDRNIRPLINYNNSDSSDFRNEAIYTMDLLKHFGKFALNLPLEEYFIYLPKVNYVISSSMLSDVRLYYQHDKAFTMSLYDEWLDIIKSEDNTWQFFNLKKYSKSESDNILYKIPLITTFPSGRINGMVCFELNRTGFNSMFNNLDLFKSGFVYATDQSNNEVFRILGSETKESAPQKLLELIQSGQFDKNVDYLEVTLDNESVVITTASSRNGLWTYYLVQPSALALSDLTSYQNAYFIIIVLTCFFCLLLIYILSRRNMKPIIKINTQLENSLQESHSLQEKLEEQKPIIYNSYMARIMKGFISSEEEAKRISDFLGLHQDQYKYCVLYACVYENQIGFYIEEDSKGSEEDSKHSDYRAIIRAYMHEYFGDNIYIYEVEVNAFAIMLPTPTEHTLEESIEEIKYKFNKLHNSLMEEQSIWIFGGLGNRNYHLPYLWKSYQQAIQAASYIREGNIFQSFHDIKRDKSSYYYPFEMAQQLSNFINVGNSKQVQEIFKLIKKENFEDVSLPVTLIRWLLSDIRNTLLKVRFAISMTPDNVETLNSVDAAFQEHKTIDLMEDISLKLCALNEQKVEGNKLIQSIQSYIKENYMDSLLSLKKISEVFNISESYFSYLFKAETKQNFSEYLELIRMNQAMILLKTTDINVSDMYLELGYNNANSFRRAFKKVHGVSPKTIRDTMN